MPVASVVPERLDAPGTHALVIGVSVYRHVLDAARQSVRGRDFAIEPLDSAARTAHRVASWLLARDYDAPLPPLASLRVLLSPQPGEIDTAAQDPRLANAPAATRANVREALRDFRKACESHRDNHAIVYVIGHGAQITKHGALLLLEDFASDDHDNLLDGALDVVDVHQALQNAAAARQQCWFVDVCRQHVDVDRALERLIGGIRLDKKPGNVEASPLFLAAMSDTQAFALRDGHSLLCDALIWALDDAAAARGPRTGLGQWHVPFGSLYEVLPQRVRELALSHGVEQFVEVGGVANPGVFHVYRDHPQVAVSIVVEPAAAQPLARLDLSDSRRRPVFSSTQWPATTRVRAGLYTIEVTATTRYLPYWLLVDFAPPRCEHHVVLEP